jgi:hypothetical protein
MMDAVLARKPRQISSLVPLSLLRMGDPARAFRARAIALTSDDTDFAIALWFDGGRAARALPAFRDYLRQQGIVAMWERAGPPDLCTRRAPGDYACR